MKDFHRFGLPNSTSETSKMILGGKGAGLVWMSQNGISVPPGFIISTDMWRAYKLDPQGTMDVIAKVVGSFVAEIEQFMGHKVLLSVRSGAPESCPGMMDTILNVGIDSSTEIHWSKELGMSCFENSYHRLVMMYGSVVKGLDREKLEHAGLEGALKLYSSQTGEEWFPDATGQLLGSIEAVFKSWDNDRAKVYRTLNGIAHEIGTAVTVQAMVFGNLNDQSGTGVLFTRNCNTGENAVTGEFLVNAQGEDVVAGIRTPMPLSKMPEWNAAVADELLDTVTKLEVLKKDVQDVEFTIQDGKLYLLQTRNAKRTATAAVRIALDMVNEGKLEPKEAISRVTAKQLDLAKQVEIAKGFNNPHRLKGIPACSGVVKGRPVFSAKAAVAAKDPVILISQETTPEDIAGMHAARGVITMTGGQTSHAAVVARGMNKPCIVGVGQNPSIFASETMISMDGLTGRIWFEPIPTVGGESNPEVVAFGKLIHKALGTTPIITKAPAEPVEAALWSPQEELLGAGLVDKVVEMQKTVGRLYIDLTPSKIEAQGKFMACFYQTGDYQKEAKAFVTAMAASLSVDKKRIVLVGIGATGFASVGSTDDLRSLVLAKGEVVVTGETSDPAVKKVLEWKKAEGLSYVTVGSLGGSKSFVSTEQALQLVNS